MTGRFSIPELRKLHAAPKNVLGNGRVVSQPQLDEYYAMHDAFPALVEAVEAARFYRVHLESEPETLTSEHSIWLHQSYQAEDVLDSLLSQFDFGNENA